MYSDAERSVEGEMRTGEIKVHSKGGHRTESSLLEKRAEIGDFRKEAFSYTLEVLKK